MRPSTPFRRESARLRILPHGTMEARIISPIPSAVPVRPLVVVRRYAGRWGLFAALAALPIYYGIHDLTRGYQAGLRRVPDLRGFDPIRADEAVTRFVGAGTPR